MGKDLSPSKNKLSKPKSAAPKLSRMRIAQRHANAVQDLAHYTQQLSRLNRQYLDLLCAHADAAPLVELKSLPLPALDLIAASPISLFSLSLHNAAMWRKFLVAADDEDISIHRANCTSDLARYDFVFSVLFFTWHLSHQDKFAARILLGVDNEVIKALCETSITQLRSLSIVVAHSLEPRCRGNVRFWADVISAGRCADEDRLRNVVLLGHQLLAAESLKVCNLFVRHKASRKKRLKSSAVQSAFVFNNAMRVGKPGQAGRSIAV